MLHLMCHFGLDTLSWSRLGASVTGVDFSEDAIKLAESIAERANLDARFICSNVYNLPQVLDAKFDIAVASYGILCWLPDIRRFTKVASHFLKPGGTFLLIDGHPMLELFRLNKDTGMVECLGGHDFYFHNATPMKWENPNSYTGDKLKDHFTTYQWEHHFGDIVSGVASSGLRITSLREFPFCSYKRFPNLVKGDDGWWRFPDENFMLPMLFSLKAEKT